MSRPPASALITVAVMVVIVVMVAVPLAISAAELPLWLDLLARWAFCLRFGVECGHALINAADRGQQGKR
jgi:hypothetical protein